MDIIKEILYPNLGCYNNVACCGAVNEIVGKACVEEGQLLMFVEDHSQLHVVFSVCRDRVCTAPLRTQARI